jgi:hypothetical protein
MTPQLVYLLFFFCISPIISNALFVLTSDTSGYYTRFPDAYKSLRANEQFAIPYITILCLVNYCIANLIITSNYLYEKHDTAIRIFIITGSITAVYGLYGFFGIGILGLPDFIPSFMDARNNALRQGWLRVAGFSDEPGSYIVIQTYCIYYLIFYKKLFNKNIHIFLVIINSITLLLTISSSLIITFSGTIFYFLFLSRKNKKRNKKNKLPILLFIFLLIGLIFYTDTRINKLMKYVFVSKIQNYFKYPTNTLDSGAMRSYTTWLGIKVFQDNMFLGCGVGCSIYFLYKYEYSFGITKWGERISKLSSPQNNHVKILSEQGLFGYIYFLLFFISSFFSFLKFKKDDSIKVHLLILITTFAFHFIGGISTNVYMWINIYLGLNRIYFKNTIIKM